MRDTAFGDRREQLARLCHRGLDVATFFGEAGRIVAPESPYDGCCWFTLDPATFLPTSHIPERSIRAEDVPRLARNEYEEEDVNKFDELARRDEPAGILSEATGEDRGRSIRYREVLSPNGFENELRVTMMIDGSPWGGAAFYRNADRPDFSVEQAQFVAAVAPYLAEGARRAILINSVATETTTDGPGLILLDDEDRIESVTPAAERLMDELVIGSSPRHHERDVTQLVLQGLSTHEIAATLHISPYTVQDHLKAIFQKAGVHSRRELVAEIFFRHYAPRMGAGDNLASSGWFAKA